MGAEHNMARRIQLRRDTAANWSATNPVLAQGEVGVDLTNNKLKIGNGTAAWNSLSYFDDKETVLSNYAGHIVPSADNTYDLGAPDKQWRDIYVSEGSIYIGDIKLSNVDGQLVVQQVTNPGEVTETPVADAPGSVTTDRLVNGSHSVVLGSTGLTQFPAVEGDSLFIQGPEIGSENATIAVSAKDNILVTADILGETPKQWQFKTDGDLQLPEGGDIVDSTGNSVLGGVGGSIAVGDGNGPSVENVTEILINGTITEIEPGLVGVSVGLPSITIPATPITLYKGLQASYGVVHSNNNSSELNVNKIVIYKPATTTVTIDSTGSQDDFQVSGLGSSDVLAMIIIYGNVNGAKPLADLQNFTRSLIDNVILVDGVAGDFRTVDQMKTEFYANYTTLAAAANGLYTNFQFYVSSAPTLNGGPTTVREGSGASFILADASPATGYTFMGVANGGSNYLPGHKIKILGTDLGGTTPENDAIITVTAAPEGVITGATVDGTAFATAPVLGWTVTGTNYNVGSGFTVASVANTGNSVSASNSGFNYVVGDVITLLGENIAGGTTPFNDITITVTGVGGEGEAYNFNVSGIAPVTIWPTNNINDGGEDQYDTANFINTNLASEINYNNGDTVVDGTAAFGAGSTYSFVYDTAMFGLFVTGNSATSISTSGNSGADGGSTTETGNVFGGGTAAETFDNAVTHINIVGEPYIGEAVSFLKTDNGNEVDILIPDDGEGSGVGITRDGNNGIYNPYREGSWDSDVSPGGTLWNIDGWADLTDVESRTYVPFYEAFGFGGLGNKVPGTECVMYLPDNGKYYTVKFSQWTWGQNGGGPGGGGFAYIRREIDLTKLQEGIRFADGTRLKSAEGLGRVKLESPGNRRIEEVYGYKQVAVTERQTTNITATASRNAADEFRFWIDTTTTNIDDILNNTTAAGIWDTTTIEFSLDNVTWYRYDFNSTGAGNEIGYGVIIPGASLNYSQGDNIYFRYKTGGEPVIWWNRNELPGGSTNFRGAVIDYHAYDTNAGTMVGTIHIARDSGDEFVTHTEVFSGGTNGENIDLWYQATEGELKYRRLDGNGATLKVQWSAKVFYGSEFWD